MSQLYNLLQHLSAEQKNSVRGIKLKGKEKTVFDFFYDCANQNADEIDAAGAAKACTVTETHLYKISSLLIRKCMASLYKNNTNDALHFLKSKNLYILLHHELKAIEKETAPEQLENFYLKSFHLLIDVPFKHYNQKEINKYAQKYLSVKKNKTAGDELYVKFHLLFAHLNISAAVKNPKKAAGISLVDLQKHEKKMGESNHYLARYYLYRCFCSWFTFYDNNDKQVLSYLKKAIALKKHIAYFFEVDIAVFLQLLYADALFTCGNKKEAFEMYSQTLRDGVSKNMYGYFYHYEQYALLAILQKNYPEALHILKTIFDPEIKNRNDIYATRGALAYAKYYLATDDYKNALAQINIARTINEKIFYLPFDIQIRVLENIYFVLTNDAEFAFQLTQRNIKFLNSQQDKTMLADYVLLFKLIQSVINKNSKSKKLTEKQEKDFNRIVKQYRNLYADVIDKIF
jgi:hypothetical protein